MGSVPAVGYTLRRAAARDALALARFAERTFRDTFAEYNTRENMDAYCAQAYGEALQRAELADPALDTWFAERDGALCGYAQLRRDAVRAQVPARHPVEIKRFYLDAASQGTGLARTLMEHVLAQASASGADAVWLGVWEHNPRAIAFYRRFGFREVDAAIFVVGDDPQRDLVLMRELVPAAAPLAVRAAVVPDELELVRTLFREYAAGLGADLEFQDFERELAALPGKFAPPRGRLLLAVQGEREVGCVALREIDAATCEMKRMYVRPQARGRGAGRLLALHLCAQARAAGYSRMWLDTLASLPDALRLYRELGFEPIAPYVYNPLPDAIYLGLELR